MKYVKYIVLLGALLFVGGCSAPPSGTVGDENDTEPVMDMDLEREANTPSE